MSMAILKLVLCSLVWLWQLSPGVKATGGAMGTVVGLVGADNKNLGTVCALQSGTLLPTCWGTLAALTPTTQPMWALTAGDNFICGLTYNLHLPLCWGRSALVTTIPSAYAATTYAVINAGADHVCAVRDSNDLSPGTVDCWGDNTYGQLLAPAGVRMLSVTAGNFFTCGITAATKEVLCWGTLGNITVPSPPSNGQFRAIFAGRLHICGIRLDGYTECWSGLTVDFGNPYTSASFSSMTGTYLDTCAIQQASHQVTCWSLQVVAPTPMPYAFSFLSASASTTKAPDGTLTFYGHICGVREDISLGNLYCWGTLPNSFASYFSTFSASKGICRDQCPEGQYAVLSPRQCPNPLHKVCLDCQGDCFSTSPSASPLPSPTPPPPPPPPTRTLSPPPRALSPPPPPPKRSIYTPPPPLNPPPPPNSNNNVSSPPLRSSSSVSKKVLPISITIGSFMLIAILV